MAIARSISTVAVTVPLLLWAAGTAYADPPPPPPPPVDPFIEEFFEAAPPPPDPTQWQDPWIPALGEQVHPSCNPDAGTGIDVRGSFCAPVNVNLLPPGLNPGIYIPSVDVSLPAPGPILGPIAPGHH